MRLGLVAGVFLWACALGAVVGSGTVSPTLFLGSAFAAGAALAVYAFWSPLGPPVLIVALIGASCDALPGPSIGNAQNYLGAMLAAVMVYLAGHRLLSLPRWVAWPSLALLAWWLVCMLRPYGMGAGPFDVLRTGLDFGVFAVLFPATVAAMQDAELRRKTLIGVGLLAAWVSVVNIGATLGVLPASSVFAHGYRVLPTGSLDRVYTFSGEIATIAGLFALSLALFGTSVRLRRCGLALFALCAAETLLELGRVKWVGFALAILAMVVTWADWQAMRRFAALALGTFVAVAVLAQGGPLRAPIEDMQERVETIFASSAERVAYEGNDTLAYRDVYKARIRAALSESDWAVGMGFRPYPWYRFEPDAIDSLRNPDLGWYNALLTMGLLGTALVFFPVVAVLATVWRSRPRIDPADRWIAFGSGAFAVYVLVVSGTLVTMGSRNGLVVSAIALGLGASVIRRQQGPA